MIYTCAINVINYSINYNILPFLKQGGYHYNFMKSKADIFRNCKALLSHSYHNIFLLSLILLSFECQVKRKCSPNVNTFQKSETLIQTAVDSLNVSGRDLVAGVSGRSTSISNISPASTWDAHRLLWSPHQNACIIHTSSERVVDAPQIKYHRSHNW